MQHGSASPAPARVRWYYCFALSRSFDKNWWIYLIGRTINTHGSEPGATVFTSWTQAEPARPSATPCPENPGGTQNLGCSGRTRTEQPNRKVSVIARTCRTVFLSSKFSFSGYVWTLSQKQQSVTAEECWSVTRSGSHVKLRRAKRDRHRPRSVIYLLVKFGLKSVS